MSRLGRFVVAAAALFWVVLASAVVLARPGGGSGYSGGGGGGSGGGDGGGALFLIVNLIRLLVWLLVDVPIVGVPLLIALVLGVAWMAVYRNPNSQSVRDWSAGNPAGRMAPEDRDPSSVSPARALGALRETDPDFSLVLFEDFLYALYAEAHDARGKGRLDTLAAYLGDAARAVLSGETDSVTGVEGIIVGALRVLDVSGVAEGAPAIHVTIELEANYTEQSTGGQEQSFYAVERWHLTRSRTARSRAPGRVNVFSCPSCGAPQTELSKDVCRRCGQKVDTGEFDWVVSEIELCQRSPRPPALTSEVAEQGTNLPSIVAPDAQARFADLVARDPEVSWAAFQTRLGLLFDTLQTTWTKRDLAPARPFVTDRLYSMLAYWIAAYKKQKLRNVIASAAISRVVLASVESDRYYDAITVRVYAHSVDYVESEDGKLVSGSRTRQRAYSEYWTLIRGSAVTGPARADKSCPQCGAALHVSMAGICTYCQSKITSGDFDWVLSRIEQDESYTG